MAFLVYSCMLCCDSLCLLSVWSDSSPQVYSLCQSLLAFWLCLERLIYLEGKCKKSIKLLSFSAWNIWNLSKPSPVSSGQIWPCAARATGGASTWPCRRVRIEGRCPAFASGVGTQRMSVICICGAHSALMYMFVPLRLGVSSKSESQCLCSQRQLLWHAMAIYVAYDSQRGTNHQLSTLLSLCACTCHSKITGAGLNHTVQHHKESNRWRYLSTSKRKFMFDMLKFQRVQTRFHQTLWGLVSVPGKYSLSSRDLEMSVTTDLLWASIFFHLLSLPLQGARYHHEPKKKGNKDTALLNRIAELHKRPKECTDRTGDESRLDLGRNIWLCSLLLLHLQESIPHMFEQGDLTICSGTQRHIRQIFLLKLDSSLLLTNELP